MGVIIDSVAYQITNTLGKSEEENSSEFMEKE